NNNQPIRRSEKFASKHNNEIEIENTDIKMNDDNLGIDVMRPSVKVERIQHQMARKRKLASAKNLKIKIEFNSLENIVKAEDFQIDVMPKQPVFEQDMQVELSEFQKFKNRLQSNLEIKSVPTSLNNLIYLENLKQIYKTVIEYTEQHKKALENLKPGKAVRFDKNNFGLTRNVQIVRSEKGKYRLFIETNTRLKWGIKCKQQALLGKGTFKKVLKCYRIDLSVPQTWACSKVCGERRDVKEALDEAAIMNQLHHPHVAKIETGCSYKNGKKISMYSKCAIGTLSDVIEGKIASTYQEKEILMMQMLDAKAYLHQQGVVHQALKPQNILIYRSKDGKLLAKVNDFGLSSTPNHYHEPTATAGYESPEILEYHKPAEDDLHDYFYDKGNNSLARNFLRGTLRNRYQRAQPSPKGDCWALGIIYFELFNGTKPGIDVITSLEKSGNPIIDGLLMPDPLQRLDCDRAYDMMRNHIESNHNVNILQIKFN
ncbi:MAG TPA: protein kinase, partial [Candidatus Berkiella sp.]|nr:protein kinase [Candidatus Berkiella sp.]